MSRISRCTPLQSVDHWGGRFRQEPEEEDDEEEDDKKDEGDREEEDEDDDQNGGYSVSPRPYWSAW